MPQIESVARLTDDARRTITSALASPATEALLKSIRKALNEPKTAAEVVTKASTVDRADAQRLYDQLGQRLELLQGLPDSTDLQAATDSARGIVRAVLDQLPGGHAA